MKPLISVIIPALDENACLGETLRRVTGHEDIEVIVVDGGSTDGTLETARAFGARTLTAPRGRASQMNAGARASAGEILFFLHADCLPPDRFYSLITDTLSKPGLVAGAFDIGINRQGLSFRAVEWGANMRSRISRVPYGDQGLFMTRRTFDSLGGFADIPLMEDIEIGRRIKRLGKVAFLEECISVSPRRWLRDGVLWTTLRDWVLVLSYTLFRVRPERLVRYYRDVR